LLAEPTWLPLRGGSGRPQSVYNASARSKRFRLVAADLTESRLGRLLGTRGKKPLRFGASKHPHGGASRSWPSGSRAQEFRRRNRSSSVSRRLVISVACFVSGILGLPLAGEGLVIPPGLVSGGLAETELLLGELGCVACHSLDSDAAARTPSRRAPLLDGVGDRVTPQFLRRFLLDPQSEKPGTTMPALLPAASSMDREDAVEDLVHWLESLSGGPEVAVEGDLHELELGRQLYHSTGCLNCHGPFETREELLAPMSLESSARANSDRPDPSGTSFSTIAGFLPLGRLSNRYTVAALTRYLIDPLLTRPSGRMPAFGLSRSEARGLAMYLLREQFFASLEDVTSRARVAGVKYAYFERNFRRIVYEIEDSAPSSTGRSPTISISMSHRGDQFGLEFEGLLRVDEPGEYTFYLRSDDGSALWIGERQVVDNDGEHSPVERSGSVRLETGEHPIRVLYFENGGGEDLQLEWEGPGISRGAIAPERLSHLGVPMHPIGLDPRFRVDSARVERGAERFLSLGCGSCHGVGGASPTPNARPMAALDLDAAGSCLANEPKVGRPRYAFTDESRRAVRAAIEDVRRQRDPPSAAGQVARGLAVFNCRACHARDGRGGPTELTLPYFRNTHGEEMGFEGSVPPPLDGVGRKLKRDWLEEVLLGRGAARPYMRTRMPAFGSENVSFLVAALDAADDRVDDVATPDVPELARHGQRLVGTQGMSCINCHGFSGYRSLGIPALDLASIGARLEKRWFREYLLDPAAYRIGTRMPKFWPDGQSARPDILDGDTDQQIEALWAYFQRGSKAPIPHGLQTAGQEIVVSDEAVIYRHWIEGAGARAIAVGYPERVNLAFDAEAVRLALLWQDGFIDARRHRTGRGDGFERPLGSIVLTLPRAVEFAFLAGPEAEWPAEIGEKAGLRFRGYELGEHRRPTFLYDVGDRVGVRDTFVDREARGFAFFERALELAARAPAEGLWFRLALGESIRESNGSFEIDGSITIRLSSETSLSPVVRQSRGGRELLVPIDLSTGAARLIVTYGW
jgi:mono/diheme cytochrome c family protein